VASDSGTLLAIDEDRAFLSSLRALLFGFGFEVVEAARAEEGLALTRAIHFDAVLLDLNLSGIGGIDLCRIMRKNSPRLPIVMITAVNSEDCKIEAFEAGADDYVVKPFQIRELAARLRAAIRRNQVAEEPFKAPIEIGNVMLDPDRHLVCKCGRPIHLTPKQFELLHYLMAHAGRPVPHATLLKTVWGPNYGRELEYLRTYIHQLRLKIEDDPANPGYLLTDSHVGYRFTELEL
jgi:two-component system KDP operon response regulator KdpE